MATNHPITYHPITNVVCVVLAAVAVLTAQQAPPAAPPPQYFLGRLSDSLCAGSHRAKASAAGMTDRECIFECIKAHAKYVLVDERNTAVPIANQDAMGLPLYAGRPVRLTGEMRDGAIFVTRVEAIPAHLHIGHVMTNWRDTPGTRGFLPVAVDEARVAVTHAKLAAKSPTPADMKLHTGHVLNALDPSVEPDGPGAKYGVKKAAAGALQHLEFASKAEGITENITSHAVPVTAALKDAMQKTDQAIALAQKIRATTEAPEIARMVAELDTLSSEIAEELQQAQSHMAQMVRAEGLEGAPR
jgi:hypothetical protein